MDRYPPDEPFVRMTTHAPGAIANGTLVEKVASEPDDAHQDGDQARVVGSIGVDGMFAYCVEWIDGAGEGIPVWIAGPRVRLVQ